MTPTAEEQASTSTHLAGRATYTTNTLHILLTQNYNPWASPPSKNQEDWGHLQEDYTGGSPHQHTGGSIYLVIVIYIVSCIV